MIFNSNLVAVICTYLKMGFGRVFLLAVLGPLLVYLVLVGHVFCRMWYQKPGPIRIDDWPRGTTREQKDQFKMDRKDLVHNVKEALAGNITSKFVTEFLTDDAEFEDFWVFLKVSQCECHCH